jgi:glycosyltransferase involved in cell wall biosynthesis
MNGGVASSEAVAALRRAFETPPNAVVIIHVSRLEPGKGHEPHLRALSRLPRNSAWRCWIVGGAQRREEREYQQDLQLLAAELGVADHVHFLGERQDVMGLLRAADVYCQPNTGPEGFGLTFIEALSNGLPVITSALGGAVEIVDESCGILVPPGDVEALATALAELITNDVLRKSLGCSGPCRAEFLCDTRTQVRRLFKLLYSAAQR